MRVCSNITGKFFVRDAQAMSRTQTLLANKTLAAGITLVNNNAVSNLEITFTTQLYNGPHALVALVKFVRMPFKCVVTVYLVFNTYRGDGYLDKYIAWSNPGIRPVHYLDAPGLWYCQSCIFFWHNVISVIQVYSILM